MKLNNILESIGNTPHVRINKLFGTNSEVWLKLEFANPGGSIKDRIALSMIEDAEKKGILKKGSIIVEPTSGNTGVSLAMIGQLKGYNVEIVMSEAVSIERVQMIKAFGAKVTLTDGDLGTDGAIRKAREMVREYPEIYQRFIYQRNMNWLPQIVSYLNKKEDVLIIVGAGHVALPLAQLGSATSPGAPGSMCAVNSSKCRASSVRTSAPSKAPRSSRDGAVKRTTPSKRRPAATSSRPT